MQFIKSFTIIASLALALSACSGNGQSSSDDIQLDVAGAINQSSAALSSCGGWWGWLTNDCNEEADVERDRCIGLSNAPGRYFEQPGTWDAETRTCVDKWPSPICYGLLMNSCESTGTDATHQCSSWNVACRVMCSKWDRMRFGGYCSDSWRAANP